jgi:hypothetical protein
MADLEKSSRASTDVEAQEASAIKEAPVALPGQEAAETVEAEPVPASREIPNFAEGGKNGWLAVTGAWAVMFITFGYMNAFG